MLGDHISCRHPHAFRVHGKNPAGPGRRATAWVYTRQPVGCHLRRGGPGAGLLDKGSGDPKHTAIGPQQVHSLWAELGLLDRVGPRAALAKEEEVLEPEAQEEEGQEEVHGGRQEQVGRQQQGLLPQPQGPSNLYQVQQGAVRQRQATVKMPQRAQSPMQPLPGPPSGKSMQERLTAPNRRG